MNRMALAGAALLAVIAALLLRKGLSRDLEARATLEEPVEVVAAERDILPGSPLAREDIQPVSIPRRALAPSTITAEHGTALLGQTLLRPRRRGEQLSWFDVAEHGRGLASAVPPGERAVTVAVNDRSGLSGMLKPNDRVDALFLGAQPAAREGEDRATVRLLLPNITVLAVGTRTGLDSAGAEEAGYGTVTLACAPEEAAALALAQSRGELVLVLRNPEDHAATAPVFLEETDLVSGGELARRRQERLEIYRRGIKE